VTTGMTTQGRTMLLKKDDAHPLEFRAAGRLEIRLAGEALVLLPEKALWWPARGCVFIADTHFGKTATFRAHGVPVCDGALADDLARLSHVLEDTRASRLVILGDLLHARRGRSHETLARVSAWRDQHREVHIQLVSGNHDRSAGPPLHEWRMELLADSHQEGPFCLRHHPHASTTGYVLAGHLHPKAALAMEGGASAKLPCFWRQEHVMVLPAFGSFIDSAVVKPGERDSIYVLADNSVHDVTPLVRRPSRRRDRARLR
jgi:uncharacterized protein